MAKDLRVTRKVRPLQQTKGGWTSGQKEARRGQIGDFSDKSRARFLEHVRNTPALTDFVTLTYPPAFAPTDHTITKRHLEAFLHWLVRTGVSAVYKYEFCRDGRPHVHLLVTAAVATHDARATWARIVGCDEHRRLVVSSAIRDKTRAEWYATKRRNSRSNRVPSNYRNMGRWWGHHGPDAKLASIVRFEGDEKDLAKIARLAKRITQRNHRQRKRRDRGVVGYAVYNGGGEAIALALERYARTLPGITIRRKG